MARAALRHLVIGLAASGLLMGCVESGDKSGASTTDAPRFAAGSTKKPGDVKAPEVFQTTDSALWDGRPSLGGIWVASPEVTDPERVVMFNPATGKSVNGALFRRERDNPGPQLQLSSDAAEALGILAGQPTEISVTALRKEEVEEPAAATAEAATETAAAEDEAAAPEDAQTAEAGEAAAIATAALDAVDAAPAEAAATPDAAAEGASADPAAVAAAGAALAEGEKPKRKTWKERRAEAKAAREAKKKATAEAKAAAAAGETLPPPEGAVATETAATGAIAGTEIETAPLDARNSDVAQAEDQAATKTGGEAEKPKKTRKSKVVAPADPTPEAAAEATPEAAPSGASRPIQVASFSKEENAKRAAEALAKIGITGTPQKSERNGKAVWGVVVTGDDAMLTKIKDAGFADAYFLN
jgi:SPOR domain